MKSLFVAAVVICPVLASCAHPLEQMVEEQRQRKVDSVYAGRALRAGAGDGIGSYIAVSQEQLTVADRPTGR